MWWCSNFTTLRELTNILASLFLHALAIFEPPLNAIWCNSIILLKTKSRLSGRNGIYHKRCQGRTIVLDCIAGIPAKMTILSVALISWYLWVIPNIWPSSYSSSYIVDMLCSAGRKWYTQVQFPHHMVQYSAVTTQYFTSGVTPLQQTVHQWNQWNPFTCSAESWLTASPNRSRLWGTARVVHCLNLRK